VLWRFKVCNEPCGSLIFAISSLLLARKSLQGHNTPMLRRCCSTSTADIRFFSNSLGLQKHLLHVPVAEISLILHLFEAREQIDCPPYMFSFEDHIRLHVGENALKKGPTRDHEITHPGPPVS